MQAEWIRLTALWTEDPWKGLYSESTWKSIIRRNLVKNSQPEGSRARLVNVPDLNRYLAGERSGVSA